MGGELALPRGVAFGKWARSVQRVTTRTTRPTERKHALLLSEFVRDLSFEQRLVCVSASQAG